MMSAARAARAATPESGAQSPRKRDGAASRVVGSQRSAGRNAASAGVVPVAATHRPATLISLPERDVAASVMNARRPESATSPTRALKCRRAAFDKAPAGRNKVLRGRGDGE